MLQWDTASEMNNGQFDIERSLTAKHLQKIGCIQGQGTTSIAQAYALLMQHRLWAITIIAWHGWN